MKPSKTLAAERSHGEYNKGPVKVGGEWNFDETEENVGGFSKFTASTRKAL